MSSSWTISSGCWVRSVQGDESNPSADEPLLDFTPIGPRFSNSVLQTLMVLLARRPPKVESSQSTQSVSSSHPVCKKGPPPTHPSHIFPPPCPDRPRPQRGLRFRVACPAIGIPSCHRHRAPGGAAVPLRRRAAPRHRHARASRVRADRRRGRLSAHECWHQEAAEHGRDGQARARRGRRAVDECPDGAGHVERRSVDCSTLYRCAMARYPCTDTSRGIATDPGPGPARHTDNATANHNRAVVRYVIRSLLNRSRTTA